jgi:hypothetical protein
MVILFHYMSPTTYAKLKKELKKELFEEFYELVIRDTKDPEGVYRPAFVKKILKLSRSKERTRKYNPKTFSKLIS